jgi:hypothetical protein
MAKQSDLLARIPKKPYNHGAGAGMGQSSFGPPLPLITIVPTKDQLDARKYSKYEVPVDHTNPDAGSLQCVIYHINGTEDLRTIILWKQDIASMIDGKRITNVDVIAQLTRDRCVGAPRHTYDAFIQKQRGIRQRASAALAQEAPEREEGESVANFNRRTNEHTREVERIGRLTMDDHNKALQAIIQENTPNNALVEQIRIMRTDMKKPYHMAFKTYVNSIKNISLMELPELPPFGGAIQSLTDADMKEIITHGVPDHWITQMEQLGFQPSNHTVEELIAVMDSQENADKKTKGRNGQPTKKQKGNNNGYGSRSSSSTGMWCVHHNVDTHNTADCNAKRFHKNLPTSGQFKRGNGQRNNGRNHNRPWTKKAEDAKTITKAEVNALIQQGFKQMKNSWMKNNKRKSNDDEANVVELAWAEPMETERANTDSSAKRRATNKDDAGVVELVNAVNNESARKNADPDEIFQVGKSNITDATDKAVGSELVRKWTRDPKTKKTQKCKIGKSDIALPTKKA